MSHDPILREEVVPRFSVKAKRPAPTAHTTIVYVDSRNEPYWPRQPLTRGEAAFRNLQRLYEVDMAEHVAEVTCKVPCRERGFYFDAHVRLRWRVTRPDQLVRDGRRDVVPLYEDHVRDLLRQESERFGYDDRLDAERALQALLDKDRDLDEGIAITRASLTLRLEQELEDHVAGMTRVDIATTQVDHEATVEETKLKAKLQRMERLGEWVSQGDEQLILLHLEQHPEDVAEVINLVEAKRRDNVDNSLQVFDSLLKAGLVTGSVVDKAGKEAVATVVDALRPKPIAGRTGEGPPPEAPELEPGEPPVIDVAALDEDE